MRSLSSRCDGGKVDGDEMEKAGDMNAKAGKRSALAKKRASIVPSRSRLPTSALISASEQRYQCDFVDLIDLWPGPRARKPALASASALLAEHEAPIKAAIT